MRAALISMAGQPRDAAGKAPLAVAGKSLALRQLEFALAAGCERILAFGDGHSAEAIALRHAAEAAGASFQAVGNSHGLLGMVRAADQLLVLAPGLLPEAPEAIELLDAERALLVLPAGPGVAAGFERIDLNRAWAGAALVRGAVVERLAELPPDAEPASALMRSALQARVPERGLPEALLAEGSWAMLGEDPGEQAWLKRHLPRAEPRHPSQWLAIKALRPLAGRLMASSRALAALAAGAVAALGASVGIAWFGLATLAFVMVALGALLVPFALSLAGLRGAPFGPAAPRWARWLPWLVDAALVACAVFAIEGSWLHRLFPPLALLGALHLRRADFRLADPFADRAVLAATFAVAAGLGLAEPAIMLAALALIALNAAPGRG